MTPRISVVMPVRDTERYVAEAVASILGQSLLDLELVVVDDGSTDGTAAIVRELAAADERVRLHAGQGGGLVASLNEGCALATAPLLARMDADDVAEPMRLARQVGAMEAEPGLVLLGSAVTQIDELGAPFATVSYPAGPGKELLERNCFAHPTVVFRRDAFERAGGYRDLFPHAEDYDLWLRLAELGRVANLPEPLLRYRVHEAQVTRRQIETQVAATLAVQAAARSRRKTGSEPPPSALVPPADAVRRHSFGAYVTLGASRIDVGLLGEAAALLDAGRELRSAGSVASRAELRRQLLRLFLRRRGFHRQKRRTVD